MHPSVLDTSAFIVGAHRKITSRPIYTTFQVLKELDHLKENPRTQLRARMQISDIIRWMEEGDCVLFDKAGEADDGVLELQNELSGVLYTQDVQLYQRQKFLRIRQELVMETRPENITEAVKHITVDAPLDGDSLEIDLPFSDFTYLFVTNGYGSRIGKYVHGRIEFIDKRKIRVCNTIVEPLCAEQAMLMDQILDSRLPMVCAIGPAGSGKTFITLQAALYLVHSGAYDRIVIAVPPVQLGGRDRYGYLPGSLEEKTIWSFSGIIDNIEHLLGEDGIALIDRQIRKEEWMLQIQSFQNIRGRSIKRSIVIIDEAQNTHPHELKTFITRTDSGSKIILLGDIEQIDTNLLSNEQNGLIYVADKMYDSDVSTNIVLKKTFRSPLVEEALKRLW